MVSYVNILLGLTVIVCKLRIINKLVGRTDLSRSIVLLLLLMR